MAASKRVFPGVSLKDLPPSRADRLQDHGFEDAAALGRREGTGKHKCTGGKRDAARDLHGHHDLGKKLG